MLNHENTTKHMVFCRKHTNNQKCDIFGCWPLFSSPTPLNSRSWYSRREKNPTRVYNGLKGGPGSVDSARVEALMSFNDKAGKSRTQTQISRCWTPPPVVIKLYTPPACPPPFFPRPPAGRQGEREGEQGRGRSSAEEGGPKP